MHTASTTYLADDMTSAVEAHSLSSITNVAANPPKHPVTSHDADAQSLTLYIARVPGMRDVFLTPLKPREKVVSAEDVQSSLYYVHVDTTLNTEDPVHMTSPSSANSKASVLPSINQAIPQTAALPQPSVHPEIYTEHAMQDRQAREPGRQPSTKIARKPVLTDVTNASPSRPLQTTLPVLPPRPLPLVPNGTPSIVQQSRTDGAGPISRHQHPPEHDRPVSNTASSLTLDDLSTETLHRGTLTLIRRNPSTSEQWNVARIYDPPVHEVSSAALLNPPHAGARIKKGGAPLHLDILNPSYLLFDEHSRSGGRSRTSTPSDTPPTQDGIFRRRLYLPGSKHNDHRYTRPSFDAYSSEHERETATPALLADNHDAAHWTSTHMDRRSKGYTFCSPWGGICEFGASTSGRSLKCRHLLPSQQDAHVISELRFNLPTSSRATPMPPPHHSKRSSYFGALHHRLHSNDVKSEATRTDVFGFDTAALSTHGDEDDPERMDLSLGQELAGGGFGGKQAKLGKLIIHPGGIEMLDLLVAANIGLWWRAWERAE